MVNFGHKKAPRMGALIKWNILASETGNNRGNAALVYLLTWLFLAKIKQHGYSDSFQNRTNYMTGCEIVKKIF